MRQQFEHLVNINTLNMSQYLKPYGYGNGKNHMVSTPVLKCTELDKKMKYLSIVYHIEL